MAYDRDIGKPSDILVIGHFAGVGPLNHFTKLDAVEKRVQLVAQVYPQAVGQARVFVASAGLAAAVCSRTGLEI